MASLDRLKTTTLILSPIQECKCGTRIDVSRYEPLQELTCPSCAKPFVVQGQLDRFQLIGIAGHGGTGTVYKAFDPQLGRQVALKVVREDRATDEEIMAQLEAEAQMIAGLNHPHILRVYSVGRAQGRFYMAMELVQGGSLDDLLSKHSVLPEYQALEITMQMALGLQCAQQAGLVHRDVKPGNVLFSNAATAKVMDFGLAVFEQQAVAASGGSVWGSPFYMAPERLQGMAEDFRSDIYSLGTVLFQMLTGRAPFDAGTPSEVAMKRLTHPAPSVLTYAPRVSNATAFVVKKMLERNRDERFQSYDELIESLQFARGELSQKGAAKTARVALDQTDRKMSMWLTAAFAGFFVAVTIAGVMMFRKSRAKDEVSPIPEMASSSSEPEKPATTPAPAAAPAPLVAKTAPSAPEPRPVSVSPAASSTIAEGVYKIKNRATDQVIEVPGWNSNNDVPVKTWPSSTSYSQRWIVRPVAGGYQLIAMHSCKAMEVADGSREDSAMIRQSSISGMPQQAWKFEPTGNGHYYIVSAASGKALTVLDTVVKTGGPFGQRAVRGAEAQQWKLEPMGDWPPELTPILEGKPLGDAPSPVQATKGAEPKNGKFVAIDLSSVANCDSRRGAFSKPSSPTDTVHPVITGWVDVAGVSFRVLDAARGHNLLILRGGTGTPKMAYPKKVEIPVNGARLRKLHFLSGVAGWGYPFDWKDKHLGVLAGQVTVIRKSGLQQVLQFRNGIEFADFNTRHDVPGSAYVDGLADHRRQIRYFSKTLSSSDPVEKLIIESSETSVAPLYLAITGEVEP